MLGTDPGVQRVFLNYDDIKFYALGFNDMLTFQTGSTIRNCVNDCV